MHSNSEIHLQFFNTSGAAQLKHWFERGPKQVLHEGLQANWISMIRIQKKKRKKERKKKRKKRKEKEKENEIIHSHLCVILLK